MRFTNLLDKNVFLICPNCISPCFEIWDFYRTKIKYSCRCYRPDKSISTKDYVSFLENFYEEYKKNCSKHKSITKTWFCLDCEVLTCFKCITINHPECRVKEVRFHFDTKFYEDNQSYFYKFGYDPEADDNSNKGLPDIYSKGLKELFLEIYNGRKNIKIIQNLRKFGKKMNKFFEKKMRYYNLIMGECKSLSEFLPQYLENEKSIIDFYFLLIISLLNVYLRREKKCYIFFTSEAYKKMCAKNYNITSVLFRDFYTLFYRFQRKNIASQKKKFFKFSKVTYRKNILTEAKFVQSLSKEKSNFKKVFEYIKKDDLIIKGNENQVYVECFSTGKILKTFNCSQNFFYLSQWEKGIISKEGKFEVHEFKNFKKVTVKRKDNFMEEYVHELKPKKILALRPTQITKYIFDLCYQEKDFIIETYPYNFEEDVDEFKNIKSANKGNLAIFCALNYCYFFDSNKMKMITRFYFGFVPIFIKTYEDTLIFSKGRNYRKICQYEKTSVFLESRIEDYEKEITQFFSFSDYNLEMLKNDTFKILLSDETLVSYHDITNFSIKSEND